LEEFKDKQEGMELEIKFLEESSTKFIKRVRRKTITMVWSHKNDRTIKMRRELELKCKGKTDGMTQNKMVLSHTENIMKRRKS
jgi:hypothetical protein